MQLSALLPIIEQNANDQAALLLGQVAEKIADPRDRLVDGVEAVGVGEAEIALAMRAEAGAGDGRDAGLFEQLRSGTCGVEAGAGDVGEGVEGAARIGAAEAGQAR